jgi:multidrug efflux pump
MREEHHGRWYLASDRLLKGMLDGYERGLSWVLRHQLFTLGVALATLVLSVLLFFAVPKGFFPQQDTDRLMGAVVADQDTSFQLLHKKLGELAAIIKSDPNVDLVAAFTGGYGATNTGVAYTALKPVDERRLNADQVIDELRKKTAPITGVSLYLQSVQDLRIGGRLSNAQYQFTLQSNDLGQLNEWAPKVLSTMRKLPELTDVSSDQQNNGLQASVEIDRQTASRLGLSQQAIDDTLYDAFGQRQASTMYTQLNQYHVVMEVAPQFWQSPDSLDHIYVRSNNGQMIRLGAFAHFTGGSAALAVNHQGQFPAVTISFNLVPGVALGNAVDAIEAAMQSIGLPAGIRGTFQGTAQAFRDSLKSEGMLILFALGTVYIVLGILYGSYIHPITILSTLPSAGVGAILALMLCRTELSVIALIGIILLIGIVKKNAIMMIDFALEAQRKDGKSPRDAIYQACILRFRPIMMTTMAAMLGGLPLAIGFGEGADLRRPLGIAIVGGLLVSQMLTLFTTPVIYLYMDRLGLGWSRLWRWSVGKLIPSRA